MDNRLNKPLRIVESAGAPDNRALADYLARVAAGDRAGFGMLYNLTSARMWSVIRRMIFYRQQAEDVLQETYLTIWRKAHLFDPAAGEALGWMTTIARHRAIEWLRQPGNAMQRSSSSTDAGEEAVAQDQMEQSVLFEELLSKLPREQRESLFLVYFYGMTQEEVSSALDVPLGTVKSRVRRGLIALKDLLDL
jgi:RNA polymerase sigma-70 factor (ECF subfamily)